MVAITRQTLSRPLLGPASYLASRGKLPLSTRTGHAAHSSSGSVRAINRRLFTVRAGKTGQTSLLLL